MHHLRLRDPTRADAQFLRDQRLQSLDDLESPRARSMACQLFRAIGRNAGLAVPARPGRGARRARKPAMLARPSIHESADHGLARAPSMVAHREQPVRAAAGSRQPCDRTKGAGEGSAIASAERRWLVFGGFALSVVLFFVVYKPWNLASDFMIGAPVGRDFVNFWTGGHLALAGRLDLLVDFAGYNDFIATTFDHHNALDERIFSYPPHILLFLVPFAALPIIPAALLWTALNVWLINRSVCLLAPDQPALRLAACLSPAG